MLRRAVIAGLSFQLSGLAPISSISRHRSKLCFIFLGGAHSSRHCIHLPHHWPSLPGCLSAVCAGPYALENVSAKPEMIGPSFVAYLHELIASFCPYPASPPYALAMSCVCPKSRRSPMTQQAILHSLIARRRERGRGCPEAPMYCTSCV